MTANNSHRRVPTRLAGAASAVRISSRLGAQSRARVGVAPAPFCERDL
jgi:hypothetical protein